jgi:hypothetical protein
VLGRRYTTRSEITAQISFTPPNRKTFKMLQASGNAKGRKVVRDLLEHEIKPARKGHNRDIDRTNYDFVLLRQENFGERGVAGAGSPDSVDAEPLDTEDWKAPMIAPSFGFADYWWLYVAFASVGTPADA